MSVEKKIINRRTSKQELLSRIRMKRHTNRWIYEDNVVLVIWESSV